MRLITSILGLFLLLYNVNTLAQQDKLLTHFMFDKMSVNPGATGLNDGISVTSIYRNQWDKINGAPNSAILNVEANLNRYFPGGLGISFYHDAIGFARQNNALLNYSFPIEFGNVGTLGLGIGVGIMNYGMNPDWVPPTTLNDPSLPDEFTSTNLDLNFGAYFKGTNFYAGISSTHLSETLLENSVSNSGGLMQSYQTARHYYLMGGYTLSNIAGGDIETNLLVRTDLVKMSMDVNARYIYDKKYIGGLTYRTSDAVAIMLGYVPLDYLTVGYSYDITVNKLASISRGSHEIMIKYTYLLPLPRIEKSRHPRWL
ncbi:MAG: PorP/SprF family type IX secretion system membrane protein [Bacteroidota bacterium]